VKPTNKVHGVLSLSAASLALFQSITSVEGKPTDQEKISAPENSLVSKTDHLILAPPHQEKLLQLYAGHSSHASHSSHMSGAGSTVDTPSYVAPTPPPQTYVQPAPKPVVQPVVATPPIVTVPFTNSVTATNQADAPSSEVDWLKKQAAEGSSQAQFALAMFYLNGTHGVEKNTEKGKMLLELAAVQGNELAKKRLEEFKKWDASAADSKK